MGDQIPQKGEYKFVIEGHFPVEGKKHTYVSQEGELPSDFIARVLKSETKRFDGQAVWRYLKDEMEPHCPDCGSADVDLSGNGFPVLGITGPAYCCRNCRACFKLHRRER